jgi:hypothetical protein
MSELYEKYLELESQLLAIQKQNPEGLHKTENEISDKMADIWYDLDETERTFIKKSQMERLKNKSLKKISGKFQLANAWTSHSYRN